MLHSEGNASISLYTKVTASKNEARSPTIENDPTNNQHQPPADATMRFPSPYHSGTTNNQPETWPSFSPVNRQINAAILR